MNLKARAVAAANHGLLTRAQALDAGMSPLSIGHALRSGELVWVRRGVYALAEVWSGLDEFGGRQRLRTRAAILTMRRDWVASHDSAAHQHRMAILEPPDPHVHITRPGFTGAWTKNKVKHHLARFSADQVVEIDDLPALDLARTAVDMAREHGTPYGEIACDAAMRMGATRAELEAAVSIMDHWPYVERTRAAVAFADPGAESLVETLGRLLVAALGVDDVETQFPARLESGRVVWGDIRVGCHVFECDGMGKYRPVADGGFAQKPAHEVVWDEKRRERDLHRVGLGTSRIIAADYFNPQRREVLARLRAELDDTAARFGTRLPEHLVRNAVELRGRRGA
jgi:hypothetical protein